MISNYDSGIELTSKLSLCHISHWYTHKIEYTIEDVFYTWMSFISFIVATVVNLPTVANLLIISGTRLGDFWKFVVTIFVAKLTQLCFSFLALLKETFFVKSALGVVWAIFGIIWPTFYFIIWSHCSPFVNIFGATSAILFRASCSLASMPKTHVLVQLKSFSWSRRMSATTPMM